VRDQRVTPKEIEEFFEAAPPHASEVLETETYHVIEWLVHRARDLGKKAGDGQSSPPLSAEQPLAFALSPAGDYRLAITLHDLQFEDDDKRVGQARRETVQKALTGGTLVANARLAGLRDGLLDSSERPVPRTLDDGRDWLAPHDGEPVVSFRVRAVNAETSENLPAQPHW